MSFKSALFGLIPVLVFTQGCVSQQTYETHVAELNEQLAQREGQIRELAPLKAECEKLRSENDLLRSYKPAFDDLSKEIKDVLASLTQEGMTRLPNGAWSVETDLLFRSGSTDVTPEGQRILHKFAQAFKGKDVRFRIVGHTDADPIVQSADKVKSRTNLELGIQRALKVMEVLVKDGFKETMIASVESKGFNEPIEKVNSAGAKKKNRRVEIYVLKG